MNHPKIANLQEDLDTQSTIYCNHKLSSNHTNYQNTRNKLKKAIKETKASFLRNALSGKQPAKVWNTAQRILNKQQDHIILHPSDIDIHFTSLASRMARKINEQYDFTEFLLNISDDVKADTFKMKRTNYDEVRKILLGIKSDCSTGHDGIPLPYLKSVVHDVTSLLVQITHTCIGKRAFPST